MSFPTRHFATKILMQNTANVRAAVVNANGAICAVVDIEFQDDSINDGEVLTLFCSTNNTSCGRLLIVGKMKNINDANIDNGNIEIFSNSFKKEVSLFGLLI